MNTLEQLMATPDDVQGLDMEAELRETDSPVRAPFMSCTELDLRSITEEPLDVDVSSLVANRSTRGGSSGS